MSYGQPAFVPPVHMQSSYTAPPSFDEDLPLMERLQRLSSQAEDAIDAYTQPLKPYVPAFGRFLIVATFLEDALRILVQWGDQAMYLTRYRGIPSFFTQLFLLVNVVFMLSASVLVIVRRYPEISVAALFFVVILQGFGYGLVTDLNFFLRNLSVLGGLLMVLSEALASQRKNIFADIPSLNETDRKIYFQLGGRVLLILLFIGFVIQGEWSFFRVLVSLLGFGACVMVAVGFKARWSALFLVLLLSVLNVRVCLPGGCEQLLDRALGTPFARLFALRLLPDALDCRRANPAGEHGPWWSVGRRAQEGYIGLFVRLQLAPIDGLGHLGAAAIGQDAALRHECVPVVAKLERVRVRAACELHVQLVGRDELGDIRLIKADLVLRDRVEERRECGKECVDEARRVAHKCAAEALHIVVLQDVSHVPRRAEARHGRQARTMKVDDNRHRALAGGHKIYRALEAPDHVADLARARLGVFAARTQVEDRTAIAVKASEHMLARLALRRDLVRRDDLGVELAAPLERVLVSRDAQLHASARCVCRLLRHACTGDTCLRPTPRSFRTAHSLL